MSQAISLGHRQPNETPDLGSILDFGPKWGRMTWYYNKEEKLATSEAHGDHEYALAPLNLAIILF